MNRVSFLLQEECNRTCTAPKFGPCDSMPVLALQRSRINGIAIYFRKEQRGLSVAFDLPTQIGYDSDHDLSEGEVGKAGVAIDSLHDMEQLFDGIELEKITTSMTINATASTLLCMYIALAKRQGASLKNISGTIQNDILKEYAARGTYIYPPKPSMRIITDIFEYCSKEVPKWNTISVSGYHIREAGATLCRNLHLHLPMGKLIYKRHLIRNWI